MFRVIKQNHEDPGGNGRHRTSNQQQKKEHPMPSLNTRRFTNLNILGTIRPESLVAWLTPAKEYLATRDVTLPEPAATERGSK